MRIVQLANAYSPTSGGLRTVVDTLGRGYVAAGHERVLVIPGQRHSREQGDEGLVVTLPSVPVSGGYRMIPRFSPVRDLLEELGPDSVEVSDKATLAAAGPWARSRGVGAVLISHERLDAVAAARFPHAWRASHRALGPALNRRSRRLATRFDTIIVASSFAGREFDGTGGSLCEIPLGVDLEIFRPCASSPASWPEVPRGTEEHPWRLVYSGRLSAEKNPAVAISTLRALIAEGLPVHLDVYGTGNQRQQLERVAADLPVTFHGHLTNRTELAARIAEADVVLAPGPAETFGLTVLEALACGTPVVTADTGGAGELLAAGAGLTATPTGAEMARAVAGILAWPESERRAAARHRAEQFPWSATVASMIDVHASLAARERNLSRRKRRGLRRRKVTESAAR
ncbi:glycosyltransferase [Catenulispora sp. NF23]|uniref:Glycosyltransferase n=1 Tax=Catenulispora pinistramenti TaxID=2705254 RepID=A0ABS5KY86_9ACTN|nr:glycosyltransferase [Catenulispora pinistramenti]MBS2537720.1 glycosyltransferase [Catenulispora pinistramenti]MBS2551036.1 glycosyltransferase [Catenulispora pinistramenti]